MEVGTYISDTEMDGIITERLSALDLPIYAIWRCRCETDAVSYIVLFSTSVYDRESHMRVYALEYDLSKEHPEWNFTFQCIPGILICDEFFIPGKCVKLFGGKIN